MNLQQQGTELINELKNHILEVLREHPDAEPGGIGVLQKEISRRAGLHNMGTGELDHTCEEMVQLLQKDGKIEPVPEPEAGQDKTKTRWRLKI